MLKNLEYKICGEGTRIVVCLHGWGLNKDCFDWLVQSMPNCKFIIPDFFGFGNSKNPPNYFDTYEYAYYIFLLLKRLKICKVVLLSHSFGGRVGIILSSVFDIQVETLILTSSAGLRKFELIREIKIVVYKIKKYLVRCGLLSKHSLNESGSVDYRNAGGLTTTFVKIVNQDLSYLLNKIKIPTYLIWDKKDKDTPYWICKKLNKNIYNSRIILYKYGKHFCLFDNKYKSIQVLNNVIIN